MFGELLETLNLPKEELVQFGNDVMERFNNPFVDHSVVSIMLNSFPKYETRDLPGLKIYLERKGELPKGLVLGLAAIITYYKGYVRTDGAKSEPNDSTEILQLLQDLWATGSTGQVAEGVLAATSIWGEDLNRIPGLVQGIRAFAHSLAQSAHFSVSACVVGDRAVGVRGQGDAQGGEHAHGGDTDAVKSHAHVGKVES